MSSHLKLVFIFTCSGLRISVVSLFARLEFVMHLNLSSEGIFLMLGKSQTLVEMLWFDLWWKHTHTAMTVFQNLLY